LAFLRVKWRLLESAGLAWGILGARAGCLIASARIRSAPVTSYASPVAFTVCKGKRDLNGKLRAVLDRGGEGLVIRQPSAPYTVGRVQTMLKVKFSVW